MSSSLSPRVALIALVAFTACRYQPTPVPIHGPASDLARLAGDWEGSYASLDSRREGVMQFTIRAGSDTAFGDVSMIPAAGDPLVAADASTAAHRMHVRAPELLRVTFVNVASGAVEGALEPYIAPDCLCVVRTVFTGMVRGGRVEGTYVTTGTQGLRQEGRWSMKRVR